MAKSDIILNEDHVLVKGVLKVDSLSSTVVNKPISINSSMEMKFTQTAGTITFDNSGIKIMGANGKTKAEINDRMLSVNVVQVKNLLVTGAIILPGFVDLIEKVKKLEARVELLEKRK